ncbi:Piso0_000748 [Millerozyma farinosa CBS 7064]|uniref:Succinate dehydrogenase assembly factor 4, mitochondrial n=1 Tax=Pichia sorbitophila (strain ATCC MYA-4447 / BCRC 22081 / CBS 7064 / NBRC 10061 / NRRL Y-12695) TaxID=559304 RepID=G8YPY4_PICSO|nr:Piso0_000748 [Millerozyma farinosa CBS 7064]
MSFVRTSTLRFRVLPSFLHQGGVHRNYSKFSMDFTPSPPKLPREQQEEFETLQKIANSQAAIEEFNDQISKSGSANSDASVKEPNLKTDIGGFHPEYFKTIPEFEGDVNPKTGERGGPKQDPLKHGEEWSFNGRVTDF